MAPAHKSGVFNLYAKEDVSADDRMVSLLDWMLKYYCHTIAKASQIKWTDGYIPEIYLQDTHFFQAGKKRESAVFHATVRIDEEILEEADPNLFKRLQALAVRLAILTNLATHIHVKRADDSVVSLHFNPRDTEWRVVSYFAEDEEQSLVSSALWETAHKNSRKQATSRRASTD